MTGDPAAKDFEPGLRAAVRDTVRAYVAQAAAGPLPASALEKLLFDGTHAVVRSVYHFSRDQRAALLPSIIHLVLAAFLEELGTAPRSQGEPPRGPELLAGGGRGWLPTAENINALPEGLRRYVHDLQTRCDPADDVQRMALMGDTIRGLDAKVQELQAELAAIRQGAKGRGGKLQ